MVFTRSSISQVRAASRRGTGRMVLGLGAVSSPCHKLARLGFWFDIAGDRPIGEREKLNLVKNNNHWDWREFSLLAKQIYSRFLWSVQTRRSDLVRSTFFTAESFQFPVS